VGCSCKNTLPLTKLPPERFLKKLRGKADVEDALKRLDKLTQEEARMATAQILKLTRSVDDQVAGIYDRVISVDDKVAEVIDGAQPPSPRSVH
jgi:hypothetical protein